MDNKAMYETLLFNVENGIAKITINRPEIFNAISIETYGELKDVFMKCNTLDDIKVVIYTGAGKHFSGGGDITEFRERIRSKTYIPENDVWKAASLAEEIRSCSKPTIAMINGKCVGAALSTALACDFRVMASDGQLLTGFCQMALSGDTGGIFMMCKLLGPGKALEYYMLGDAIKADEAERFGLVYRVVEPELLEQETLKLARRLAAGPRLAYRKQKQLFWEVFYRDFPIFSDKEIKYLHECSESRDFEEAVESFLEKRAPKFTGQ